MTPLERAIEKAGGATQLAAFRGLRQSAVSNWKSRGVVPEEHCPWIEEATGVTCEELRPDLTWIRDDAGKVTHYQVPLSKEQPDAA